MKCPTCKSRGHTGGVECFTCGGSGKVPAYTPDLPGSNRDKDPCIQGELAKLKAIKKLPKTKSARSWWPW